MYLLGGICIVISKSTSYFDKASLTGYDSIKKTPICFVNTVSVLLLKIFHHTNFDQNLLHDLFNQFVNEWLGVHLDIMLQSPVMN